MTLLFSSHGSNIGAFDKDPSVVKATLQKAASTKGGDTSLVHGFSTLQKLMAAFTPNKPRIVVFSLPHGGVVDEVLEEIGPLMSEGDLIVDGGNEQYRSTERRQKWAKEEWGVKYLGMGVSGGCESDSTLSGRLDEGGSASRIALYRELTFVFRFGSIQTKLREEDPA